MKCNESRTVRSFFLYVLMFIYRVSLFTIWLANYFLNGKMDFLYSASEMKRNEKQSCNQLQIQCVRKINSSKSNYSEYFMRGNFIRTWN